ncbi:hypothetical protein [Nocardia farcinica]|uniref:hypothetical protein n=1 Tax=Nocardia farcinica TaxID=37329 RepID=UPI002456A788|nr:hypothetical protein [Nocardia farcinica]
MSCQSIITPDDCKTFPSQITAAPEPAPAPAAPAAPGEVLPGIDPARPFGDGPDDAFFGGALPLPEDLTWTQVGDFLIGSGVGLAFTLILTALLLVPSTLLAWTPARMRNWTIAAVVALPGSAMLASADAAAPFDDFREGMDLIAAGDYVPGVAEMSLVLIPVAWLLAMIAHTNRRVKLLTNGFQSPARTERALWAQSQREQRAAARLSRRRLPFTSGYWNPQLVIGRLAAEHDQAPTRSMLRQLTKRAETRLLLPWINVAEHMTTVASSGSGKTTLMLRVLVSWFVTTWTRHRQWWRHDRPGRPLAIIVDCNGGPESRKVARRMRTWFEALGVAPERIGIFPDTVSLAMWPRPDFASQPVEVQKTIVDDLRSILSAMVSGGSAPTTETEKYFYELRTTLIHLIVDAPARIELVDGMATPVGHNPPANWLDFLSRFDPTVIAKLWGGVFDDQVPWAGVPGIDRELAATMAGKTPAMDSTLAEFANLYRSLGEAFDGDRQLTDFDVLYIVLEGVKTPDRARAQFGALGTMFEQLADKEHGRTSLMVVDEFSAVSDGKTRAVKWVERLRKAGIGSWWIAQSWQGLGHDDDNRAALVAAASGGSLIGRSTDPETISKIYGTRHKFELSRKLISGSRDGDEGNVQTSDQYLLPPNRLRAMQKGDVVQVSGGRARWGRVSPLDDAELKRLRPLPGLTTSLRAIEPAPEALAPVIDLTKKRRPA